MDSHNTTINATKLSQQSGIQLHRPMSRPYDFVNWFYDTFVLAKIDSRVSDFMIPIMGLSAPNSLLTSALLAVSVTRFGVVAGDIRLVREGRLMYGYALQRLHAALEDPQASREDETLACTAVISLYEVRVSAGPLFKLTCQAPEYKQCWKQSRLAQASERHHCGARFPWPQSMPYSRFTSHI